MGLLPSLGLTGKLRWALALLTAPLAVAEIDVLPTPHYLEPLDHVVRFSSSEEIKVSLSQASLKVAMEVLTDGFPEGRFMMSDSNPNIVLTDFSVSREAGMTLNLLDRHLLEETPLRSQSYVLRSDEHTIRVVGGGPAGVMYGAATVAQLLRKTSRGIEAPGAYMRDHPDFEFRAAADWLLDVEINRWALDRGRGLGDYSRLVRKELDQAVRYKANVALIDGFGWSLEKRPPGYGPVMRSLSRYARERGILLQFGGYGAAYDMAQQEGEYQGKVFLNRESYPSGPVYRCLAFPERQGVIDPRTMGSCRGNEQLNLLKAEDLAHFADTVEPGVLYIHHEDCCVFEDFQKAWLGRCERCRRRWPNDSLLAADGGAGALAHGYGALIEAVNRTRHPDTGYDASRDTQIVLVSPVYMPATPRSEDWGQVLELWRSITRLLPRVGNVQICFREILPQPGGGERWVPLFNAMMQQEDLPFRAYVFVVGGGDGFLSDYPTTGVPAMNIYFRGARTIYNATGDPYRLPLEILSAEYAWNMRSTGFYRDPRNQADMSGIEQWIYRPANPPEIYGPGRLFDRICAHLYGPGAGAQMSAYYRMASWIPDVAVPEPPADRPYYRGRRSQYLPRVWNYANAVPSYWYHLLMDSRTWGAQPDEKYQSSLNSFPITIEELHRRLSHRWSVAAELNRRGSEQVRSALAEHPKPDSIEDLQFLSSLFRVYQPLIESLRDYHGARASSLSPAETRRLCDTALENSRKAGRLASSLFPEPVDLAMGEVRSLRTYPQKLEAAIAEWSRSR
jgi:hypothetical protein